MEFYKSIAQYYDYIFPANKQQIKFAASYIDSENKNNILDIGCGTGNLLLSFSNSNSKLYGIDLDNEMLEIAKKKDIKNSINFSYMNMLTINEKFDNNKFDTIICFGNTIVHLDDLKQINQFVEKVRKTLKNKGNFLIQLINYDRIIDQNINCLSTIDNEVISFKRNYTYIKKLNKIQFDTKLVIKKTNDIIENSILLYPLRKKELINILENNGFVVREIFGSFQKSIYGDEAIPLIISCE